MGKALSFIGSAVIVAGLTIPGSGEFDPTEAARANLVYRRFVGTGAIVDDDAEPLIEASELAEDGTTHVAAGEMAGRQAAAQRDQDAQEIAADSRKMVFDSKVDKPKDPPETLLDADGKPVDKKAKPGPIKL